jgi:hypothetical protein
VATLWRKRHRQDYRRWQREEPMQLWQLDVTGSVFLADGTELKLVSGLDDCRRHEPPGSPASRRHAPISG